MKIAVHQPHLLPWSGFWAKVQASNTTLIMLNTQYVKGEYLNRVKLNDKWISLEVLNHTERMSKIVVSRQSVLKMKRTLSYEIFTKDAMKKNNQLMELEAVLFNIIDRACLTEEVLLEVMNVRFILALADYLGVCTTVLPSIYSEVGSNTTERLFNYIDQHIINAPYVYLSGSGGRHYLDEKYISEQAEVMVQELPSFTDTNTVLQIIKEGSTAINCINNAQQWTTYKEYL